MTIKGKRIFITGGAGFIGSSLVGRLIQDNEIVVYDNLQRNALNDTASINHPNLKLIQENVLDAPRLSESMKHSHIVIHMAAVIGVPTVIKDPMGTLKTNIIATFNVLESAMRVDGLERLLNVSTSEVYGEYAYKLGEGELTSLGAVGEARWTYAISKLAGEHAALSCYKQFGLPVVSVRPFNIYGPRRGEAAIYLFISKALKNEDIEIHGDGDQIRSWCFIDNIATAKKRGVTRDRKGSSLPPARGWINRSPKYIAVITTTKIVAAIVCVYISTSAKSKKRNFKVSPGDVIVPFITR